MIPFTSHQRYHLYNGIMDFRKGYQGMCGIIRSQMECNPDSGEVYLFINKRNNQVRMVTYDTGGYVILMKKLTTGTFESEFRKSDGIKSSLSWTQLMCVMHGIKLSSVKYRKRFKSNEKKNKKE